MATLCTILGSAANHFGFDHNGPLAGPAPAEKLSRRLSRGTAWHSEETTKAKAATHRPKLRLAGRYPVLRLPVRATVEKISPRTSPTLPATRIPTPLLSLA